MNIRRLGGVVVAGALGMAGLITPHAHAAVVIRSPLTLVGGEDPTFDAANPSAAEARWQDPVRRIDIFAMDAARFPSSVPGNAAPCVATMSVGDLTGTAVVIDDPKVLGGTTAGLRDAGPGFDGQLAKVDVVCDWTDLAGALQHHETHWAGELGFAPVASLPSSLAFDALRVGNVSADQVVTLTNVGNLPMHVTSAGLTGTGASHYGLTDNQCAGATIAPSSSCTVAVHFAPLAAGNLNAALTFADDAVGRTHSVALAATGLEPNIAMSPDRVRFGNETIILATRLQTVRVTNTGNMELSLGRWSLSGDPDFKIVADSCSNQVIAAAGSCSVTIQFQPLMLGLRLASIDAVSDAPDSAQHSISISGNGVILG